MQTVLSEAQIIRLSVADHLVGLGSHMRGPASARLTRSLRAAYAHAPSYNIIFAAAAAAAAARVVVVVVLGHI